MSDEQKKNLPINYTNREFSGIRDDLLELAERFYPDSFQDFSEASFGEMMLDAVAYVGDQLSFYLDYNVNESFLDTAYQFKNVVRHGRILGYKYTGRSSTYGKVALYIQVPASATGLGPDLPSIPILKRGSRFYSQNGLNFVLTENVDFSMLALFMSADLVVKSVIIILVLASIYSWTIIVSKLLRLRQLKQMEKEFDEIFWSGNSFEDLYETFNYKVAQ